MAMGTRKIGPAVAAGCTMVIKPAAADAALDARARGDPRGGRPARRRAQRDHVLVVERGLEADHRRPAAAQADASRARPRSGASSSSSPREGLLRTSMELGGNAPFLVFADADVDAAVEGAVIAKMRNIGEACTAANRFHVAEPRRRRVRREARRAARRDEGRPRHRGGRQGRPADRRRPARQGRRAGRATRSARARRRSSAARRATAPATSTSRPCWPTSPATRGCSRRRSSARSRRSSASTTRRPRSPPPTTPSTASSPTSTRRDLKRAFRVCEGLETGMVGLNQGHRLQPGGAVRRRQGVRLRPRGRPRGHRRVPRDQVRRDGDVSGDPLDHRRTRRGTSSRARRACPSRRRPRSRRRRRTGGRRCGSC